MKRFTAFFLVLMMVMSCCASAQADEFTPTETNKIDATAEEWLSTPTYRILFTLSIFLDFTKEVKNLNLSKVMEHSFYLGKDKNDLLILIFQDSNYDYLLLYDPVEKEAAYSQMDGLSPKAAIEILLSRNCGLGNYYVLDPEDIFD